MFAIGFIGLLYVTGAIGDGLTMFGDLFPEGDEPVATPTTSEPRAPADLFDDDDGSDAEGAIETAVRAGVLFACGEEGARTFCPQQPITRAEFAVALDAALSPPDAPNTFTDVPEDAQFAGAVARLAADGVISGCGEQRFCPQEPVTRAQAAALIARTLELPATSGRSFEDVPADSTFAGVIGQVTAEGIMDSCVQVPPRFCPDEPLTRADAASLLVQAGLAD